MARQTKILIIENDLQIADLYKNALLDAKYEVKVADTGNDGLNVAKSFSPQVVLIDILLPDILGPEILEMLRENPEYNSQTAKLVYFTNIPQDKLSKFSNYDEADGYVIKADTSPKELVTMLKTLFQVK